MEQRKIRWIQRFENYSKALAVLREDVEESSQREFSQREKRGTIKSFELVQELSWKTLKDFFEAYGETEIRTIRDVFALAFQRGLCHDDVLIRTIKSRNSTVHTYDEHRADQIFNQIRQEYFHGFDQLEKVLLEEKKKRG